MRVDEVGKVLKSIHRDNGIIVLWYEDDTLATFRTGGTEVPQQVPSGELDSWTLVLLGRKTADEYKEEQQKRLREAREIAHHKIEDEDYFKMWQLYHKYGGERPSKFPSEVLIVAKACQWDSPEHVDVTLKGVSFHVTKKDME